MQATPHLLMLEKLSINLFICFPFPSYIPFRKLHFILTAPLWLLFCCFVDPPLIFSYSIFTWTTLLFTIHCFIAPLFQLTVAHLLSSCFSFVSFFHFNKFLKNNKSPVWFEDAPLVFFLSSYLHLIDFLTLTN